MSHAHTESDAANQSERTHTDNDAYLRDLYAITSDPDRRFEAKLDDLFVLGCDRFDLEMGAIARVTPETDSWQVEHTSSDHDRIQPGVEVDLSETYCRLATDDEEPVGMTDPENAGFNDALCYEEFGVETYLGTHLEFDEQADRTFFFISTQQRDQAFSEAEQTFLHLMGEWLRKELQRKHREEQLQQANERLESFASMLAHELRNPLNIAQVYMQMALNGDEGAAEEVTRAHDRIEEMIDILLVTARGSDATIDWEAVVLRDVITDAWADEATEMATLEIETDETIPADATHVRHLFQNLFRNAVEHGDEDVTVRVGDIADADGFYVEDDGPGIPESERETVFAAGYTTDADGIGLGLTFIAQLAETYGWETSVQESRKGGARFEFHDVKSVPEY